MESIESVILTPFITVYHSQGPPIFESLGTKGLSPRSRPTVVSVRVFLGAKFQAGERSVDKVGVTRGRVLTKPPIQFLLLLRQVLHHRFGQIFGDLFQSRLKHHVSFHFVMSSLPDKSPVAGID